MAWCSPRMSTDIADYLTELNYSAVSSYDALALQAEKPRPQTSREYPGGTWHQRGSFNIGWRVQLVPSRHKPSRGARDLKNGALGQSTAPIRNIAPQAISHRASEDPSGCQHDPGDDAYGHGSAASLPSK